MGRDRAASAEEPARSRHPGRRSRKRAICYDMERYRGRLRLIENALDRREAD